MKKGILLLIILPLLTGCWDRIEVEDRGFVVGVGIDLAEEENKIMLTQQIVVPSGVGGGSGQSGGGTKGGSDAYMNVKAIGEASFQIVRQVAAKTSRTPFYAHVKVIIISEDAANKHNIGKLLDYFIRDTEMRRGAIVLISKNKASEILETVPKNEKLPATYIDSLLDNTYKNAEIYPKTRIGEVHENLLDELSFPLTIVEKSGKEIELKNTAIIYGQSDKLVGTLKRDGTIGVNFIQNNIEGGIIKAEYQKTPILYEIYRSKTSIKADVSNLENITFDVEVDLEGAIGESLLVEDFTKPEQLHAFEKQVEKEIKQKILTAFYQCKELNADAIDFGLLLKQNHYHVWKKIKNDWEKGEKYFTKSSMNVDVNVIIRNTGSVIQTNDKNEEGE